MKPPFSSIDDYAVFLADESRLSGLASTISFPKTEAEIADTCAYCHENGIPITVQGSRTGISGGAVPCSGHVLSMTRMSRVLGIDFDPGSDEYILRVEPGLTLGELDSIVAAKTLDPAGLDEKSRAVYERFIKDGSFFFPPDPTETTASIGGMVSCNASGARSFGYGSTRDYVRGLRIILADGRTAWVRRKVHVAEGRRFSLTLADCSVLRGILPSYAMVRVKNAAGYFAKDDMDLVDLFTGSEGTLAVVSAIELALARSPASILGVTVFFGSEVDALGYVAIVRGDRGPRLPVKPVAIEYFDPGALSFIRRVRYESEVFSRIPAVPEGAQAAVYAELHAGHDRETDDAIAALQGIIAEQGGAEDTTWIATNEKELDALVAFRHALPEAVNMRIASLKRDFPEITKLGTDMSVPDDRLVEMHSLYRGGLEREGLESVIFGHIGANHLHVNVIPRSVDEYARGKSLYWEWARKAVALGGSVSAEHGIGKLKLALLEEMYGRKGIEEMRSVKELFDPRYVLGRGNLFPFRGA